ncbi:MAG: MMPL family transporter [Firmicutes bacterium]|jgi:predicted RND superfamily exporter protein|nr:MMPL family transporter [Bacillota bacterium]MDH7496216.1 MMPL family transporter [Bacillota bacterium]
MERLARYTVKHPGTVATVLCGLTLVFACFLPRVQLRTDTAAFAPEDDPVIKELAETVEDFGSQDIIMVVVKGDVFAPETLAKVRRLADGIANLSGVDRVTTPLDVQLVRGDEFGLQILPAAERVPETLEEAEAFRQALKSTRQGSAMVASNDEAMAIFITLEPGIVASTRAHHLAGEIEGLVRQEESPGQETYIVGEAYMGYWASRNMRRDLRFLLPLAVAVVIGALYASFGSLSDVGALLGGIVMSVVWTVGLMAGLGYEITIVSMMLPTILVSMGSAAGIHVLNRFYEETRAGGNAEDSIVRIVVQLTSPISMTTLTTAVGFASFLTSFVPPVREFGALAAVGIILNMLISLTWVPAVLAARARRLATSAASTLDARSPGDGRRRRFLLQELLGATGRLVVSRPREIVIGAVAVTLAFAAGIPGLAVETNFLRYFREDSPAVTGTKAVEDHFGGTLGLSVLVDTGEPDGIKDPSVLNRMIELENRLKGLGEVSDPTSVASLIREVNQALNNNDPSQYKIPDSREAVAQELLLFTMQGGSGLDTMVSYDFQKALVTTRVVNLPTSELHRVIEAVEHIAGEVFGGTHVKTTVVGLPKVMLRLMDRFMDSQIKSLVVSMAGVWAVITLVMGSASMGLLCLVALFISVIVNFGLMSFSGIPLDVVTIMISGVAIGIGVDYSIHVLSRYRLELRQGKGREDALASVVGSTGRGVFFNAATLILGFGLLTFSSFRAISVFGLLVAATMFTSALGALLVLPAVLRLLPADRVRDAGFGGVRRGRATPVSAPAAAPTTAPAPTPTAAPAPGPGAAPAPAPRLG